MVAYFRPMVATLSATRRGSSRSSGAGLPVSIWQKSQRRVHCSPPMRNVASRSSQHSKMLGQPASSQTVCRPSRFTSDFSSVYSGPVRSRVLIHGGFFSIGTAALRTSSRNMRRPSGVTLMASPRYASAPDPHFARETAQNAPGLWLDVSFRVRFPEQSGEGVLHLGQHVGDGDVPAGLD